MYLTQIGHIDDRWSIDADEACKNFLHKILTYKEINKFFNDHTNRQYRDLCKVFPSVAQHGYDLKEAMEMDLTLIKR